MDKKILRKNLKAFTMVEILVSMVITAIAVLLAFNAFIFIQQQYYLYKNTATETSEYIAFSTQMTSDFQNEQYGKISGNSIIFMGTDRNIEYHFVDSAVIRIDNRQPQFQDSFKIKAYIIKKSFENHPVGDALFDNCIIGINAYGEKQQFLLSKQYSATDLMNYFH